MTRPVAFSLSWWMGRMEVRGGDDIPAGMLPASPGSCVKAGDAGWLCGAWPAPGTTRALLPEQESCFMLWFLLNEFKAWPSSRQSLGQVPAEQPPGRALEQGGANSREEQRNPRRQICLENSSVSICWVRSCYRNCDDRGRAISWACLCVGKGGRRGGVTQV